MRTYGWIPYEEFKNLPIAVVNALTEQINEDYENQKRQIEKQKSKKRIG
jgi:hypothetical protein